MRKRRRFSVRDLLVFITLVAAAAGLVVGMINVEEKGVPRPHLPGRFDFDIEKFNQAEESRQTQ
ncbi:MAG: hypothetical protein WD669_10430 [Pirellulales bacterium]